ncbi:hypothetical protein Q1695_003634 [Nippostrongylus brasiliensis]|nr:hypothetical protein Q1695_003634 [Nippostrongylus brasiliensis]
MAYSSSSDSDAEAGADEPKTRNPTWCGCLSIKYTVLFFVVIELAIAVFRLVKRVFSGTDVMVVEILIIAVVVIVLLMIVAGILTENPTIALVVFLLVLLKVIFLFVRAGLDVYNMITKEEKRQQFLKNSGATADSNVILYYVVFGATVVIAVILCVFILLGLWRLRVAWVDKAAEEQKSSQQAPA